MKYFLVQLGCQMNRSDSERIASVLRAMGYGEAESETEASLLGVIACSVRQKGIDKVYSLIEKWNGWKKNRDLLTFVSGCILPDDRERFLKRFDLIFSINELAQVPAMIAQYGVPGPFSLKAGGLAEAQELAESHALAAAAVTAATPEGSSTDTLASATAASPSKSPAATSPAPAGVSPDSKSHSSDQPPRKNRGTGPLWLANSPGPQPGQTVQIRTLKQAGQEVQKQGGAVQVLPERRLGQHRKLLGAQPQLHPQGGGGGGGGRGQGGEGEPERGGRRGGGKRSMH